MSRLSPIVLLLFSCASLAQGVPEGDTDKQVHVVRASSAPVIDGRLDEAVWNEAEVLTDFHQTRPGNGAAPSDPTEVYLLYDDDYLYIGARMYDSEPERIAAPTVRHGEGLGRDDRIVIILDPFNAGRGAYRFETNANGVRHDALYDTVSSFEAEWTVIWDSAAQIFDEGWEAEIAIPFKTLPFDPKIDTWGFNFGRGIRRRGEEIAWVSRNRAYNASILGKATGLTGMDRGMGLDIVPSVSMTRSHDHPLDDTDYRLEPSLDLYYRLTPSLNASLTLNTDFSATEVDDRQVNLTRFSLFFPEKRDFFLKDADLFSFGRIGDLSNEATSRSSDNNGRPFFSRRLGLSRSGQPVDLDYGGKLSGRVGRWNIGMLAMRQAAFGTTDASNVMVGRLAADVLSESTVGMMVTHGDPNSNLGNNVAGADFRYLNTRLAGGRVLEADGWVQRSDTEGLSGDESAWGIGVAMPNNTGWRGGVHFRRIGQDFNPALGFVSRTGVRDWTGDVGYTHYTRGNLVQSLYAGLDMERIDNIGGGLQSQVLLARLLELETNTRDSLALQFRSTRENVTRAFTLYEDERGAFGVPVGEYDFNEAIATVTTGGQRDLAGEFSISVGDFYDGKRTNYAGSLTWRQSRYFTLTATYDRNDIRLPRGDFVTHLGSLISEVTFTPTIYWITLLQYDNVSEVLGINSRLVWIPRAGQEALLVLNHSLEDTDHDNHFQSGLQDITLKLSYTFRF